MKYPPCRFVAFADEYEILFHFIQGHKSKRRRTDASVRILPGKIQGVYFWPWRALTICSGRVKARELSGTSLVMVEPAPTMLPSPMLTGATRAVLLPMKARAAMVVRCFLWPS